MWPALTRSLKRRKMAGVKMSDPAKLQKAWQIYKGYVFQKVIIYKNKATGNPIDLTGYAVTFKAKPSVTYATNTISLSVGSGIVLDGPAGRITVNLTTAQTAALIEDKMIFTLAINDTALMYGEIIVSEEVV